MKSTTFVMFAALSTALLVSPVLQIRSIGSEGVDAFDPIAHRLVRRSLLRGAAEL